MSSVHIAAVITNICLVLWGSTRDNTTYGILWPNGMYSVGCTFLHIPPFSWRASRRASSSREWIPTDAPWRFKHCHGLFLCPFPSLLLTGMDGCTVGVVTVVLSSFGPAKGRTPREWVDRRSRRRRHTGRRKGERPRGSRKRKQLLPYLNHCRSLT